MKSDEKAFSGETENGNDVIWVQKGSHRNQNEEDDEEEDVGYSEGHVREVDKEKNCERKENEKEENVQNYGEKQQILSEENEKNYAGHVRDGNDMKDSVHSGCNDRKSNEGRIK